jgi:hypothetical protein
LRPLARSNEPALDQKFIESEFQGWARY